MMDGQQYCALRTLSARAADGRLVVVAKAGETCEKVAPASLPWLLEQGCIVAIDALPTGPAGPDHDDDEAVS